MFVPTYFDVNSIEYMAHVILPRDIHFSSQQSFAGVERYDRITRGCLANDYRAEVTYQKYVEVSLSGCIYLCRHLHDLTCSMILYVPANRSCILQPAQDVVFVTENCTYTEIHHRQRRVGKYTAGTLTTYWESF